MENKRIEFKRMLNDDFEKKTVGFLNAKEGGNIYIGIDDDGAVFGVDQLDEVQKAIANKYATNILPSMLGLYDIDIEQRDGKNVIHVTVASGAQKPYYIAQYGMSPKGCFIRSGSACMPMTVEMIEEMHMKRLHPSLSESPSPVQNLTFEQLKIFYEAKGKVLNEKFAENIRLLTKTGEYNYVAYLMSDVNSNSMRVAKFSGLDKTELLENNEYGYCSLIKAVKSILDRIDVENTIKAEIHFHGRKETPLLDKSAIKEVVINAAVHNAYDTEIAPIVMFYSDRVEITSMGGLPYGITEAEFFDGTSRPRNPGLMRIFIDLNLVEHLGTGLKKIVDVYGKEAFHFFKDHIIVVLPFNKEVLVNNNSNVTGSVQIRDKFGTNSVDTLTKNQIRIIEVIKTDNTITAGKIAKELSLVLRTVEKNLSQLKKAGYIVRHGENKGGTWEVIK